MSQAEDRSASSRYGRISVRQTVQRPSRGVVHNRRRETLPLIAVAFKSETDVLEVVGHCERRAASGEAAIIGVKHHSTSEIAAATASSSAMARPGPYFQGLPGGKPQQDHPVQGQRPSAYASQAHRRGEDENHPEQSGQVEVRTAGLRNVRCRRCTTRRSLWTAGIARHRGLVGRGTEDGIAPNADAESHRRFNPPWRRRNTAALGCITPSA